MKKEIIINGRFLTGPLTGVQRTAYELVSALDELISRGDIDSCQYSFILVYSGDILHDIRLKHIKILKRGVLKGNLWEQLELPLLSFDKLLINMCSIAPLLKRKQILFVHDVSFLVNKGFFSKSFRLWYANAIPILGKICRRIVTVSEFSKQELIDRAGVSANKISVIYNAADHILKFDDPGSDFMKKIDSYKPFCLAVSNLGANKNFKNLSAAIKEIDFSGYKMLIAGGKIGALKTTSPDVDATYLGYVSDEELNYLYRNASLFVFPSFYEGFGIPPLEAMMLGCPVIASHTSAMPEVLQDASDYFDPYNTKDMGLKIEQLIHDDDRLKELRAKGHQQALKYNWRKSAAQLFNLISQADA